MKTDLENRQAHAESNRSGGTPHVKEIGPHEHSWEFYAIGADGGEYQVCQLCNARRVTNLPLVSAAHRDWIEGTAKWKPTEEEAAVPGGVEAPHFIPGVPAAKPTEKK